MDSFALRRLAEQGFSGDTQLTDLAVWCIDFCEASGDARYCSVGQALRSLDEWWSRYDESGGVPAEFLRRIEEVVKGRLPDILDTESAADAAPLARLFRQEVESLLFDVRDWPTA